MTSAFTRPRWCITVLQISAADVLDPCELDRRLDHVARLPLAQRRRFGVQLRDPQLCSRTLWQLGRSLRARTQAMGAHLIVNDRLDVALALNADGVHLGRTSLPTHEARRLLGPRRWISRSLHQLAALTPIDRQVDAWLLSPIFATAGKGPPLGPAALTQARALLDEAAAGRVALLALGGVSPDSAAACIAAGADGAAAIRADLVAWLAATSVDGS